MEGLILKDIRKTKTIELPSFEGSKIIIYDQLLGNQNYEVSECKNDYNAGIKTLKYLIKEWNFVDKDGKPLSISEESLGMLPSSDLTFVFRKIAKMAILREGKKKENLKK